MKSLLFRFGLWLARKCCPGDRAVLVWELVEIKDYQLLASGCLYDLTEQSTSVH